jgi:hypothetical protein
MQLDEYVNEALWRQITLRTSTLHLVRRSNATDTIWWFMSGKKKPRTKAGLMEGRSGSFS